MQWNQIKTLFIICFLVLDVYLLIKFIDKQEETDIGVLEQDDTSIEQQLKSENISLPDLPDEGEDEEQYVSLSPREFSEDDRDDLGDLKNQESTVIDDRLIVSEFKDPVSLPLDEDDSDVFSELSDMLLYSDEYEYWGWDESLNMLILFQEQNDRPIYYNENGIIFVFLNDDNEAVYYTQTLLEDEQTTEDEYALIKPMEAIETLYNSNELSDGDDITNVSMGFHTRIPLESGESGVQVFSPTWRLSVNDDSNYFVNAIEGLVYPSGDEEFLEKYLESISDKTKHVGDKDLQKDVSKLLDERFDVIEGGEDKE